MNPVQNGGVPDPYQTDIKNSPVQNRTIVDQGVFKIHNPKKPIDEHLFRHIFVPGSFHYCQGRRKTGKTQLCVTLMNLLSTGFDMCGEWEIITNIFFYHSDKDGIVSGTPERIHHVDSIEEIFERILEYSDTGKNIAIFLDDIDKIYNSKASDPLALSINKLVENRNKLQVLVFLSDGSEVSDFLQSPCGEYPSDCEWQRYDSQALWEDTIRECRLGIDWNYLHVSSITHFKKGSFEIYNGTTEWTDLEKESGWLYDSRSYASVLRCSKAFDPETFWRGVENVSSVSVMEYIRRYTSVLKVEKSTEGTTIFQSHGDTVSVAIRLKSMGLTDEAIECAIGVPKTTLRRWVEKAGHKWKVGEIDVPYRFKALRGNDLPEVE